MELWVMYDTVDTSDDRRISLEELSAAQNNITEWGLTMADVAALFRNIDRNNGGMILFDEFAHWAILHKLDLASDDDVKMAGTGSGLIKKQYHTSGPLQKLVVSKKNPYQRINWNEITAKLPCGGDAASKTQRAKLWRKVDGNGNGIVSLAEFDRVIVRDLALGDTVAKPVMLRAFTAAKGLCKVFDAPTFIYCQCGRSLTLLFLYAMLLFVS